MRSLRHDQTGFSLIETMAAITVFALITVGITPLLISSMRGTSLARAHTVAKNIVSEAMERIRGLPYYDGSANRDVLDFYYPNLGTGFAAGVFTTVCSSTSQSPAPSAARACPPKHSDVAGTSRIPPGYTITFEARFVEPVGETTENFNLVTPAPAYNSATESTSVPPTQLIEMTITARWMQLGRERSVQLKSLVGDRKLTPDKARASAVVDHIVRVESAYLQGGKVSGLSGTAARLTSEVEIRGVSSASLSASAGELTLTEEETSTSPGTILDRAVGATAGLRAPPNAAATAVSASPDSITHPSLFGQTVGRLDSTIVNENNPAAPPGVTVTDGYPKSVANLSYTAGVGEHFWMTNQALLGLGGTKRFSQTANMFAASRPEGAVRIRANTSAEATAEVPLANRKVESIVHIQAPRFNFLPTTFTSGVGGVVYIDNFVADITCKSTGSAPGAVATGSWSATLFYWRHGTGYVSVPLSGNVSPTLSADPLAAIMAENPLVKQGTLLSPGDVYLFQDATHPDGYLEDWSSTWEMSSSKEAEASSVSMPYAIKILTAQTNPSNEETKFAVEIGKISCQAVDNRA